MKRISTLTKIQPNAPGTRSFNNNELKAELTNATVKDAGVVYVGREFAGDEVVVLVLRR